MSLERYLKGDIIKSLTLAGAYGEILPLLMNPQHENNKKTIKYFQISNKKNHVAYSRVPD